MALTNNGKNHQVDSTALTIPRRRPVAIIDPITKQKVDILADTPQPSTSNSSFSASVNTTRPLSNTRAKRSPKTIDSSWKPDVYVKSFIPRAFTAINSSPAVQINSMGVDTIKFKEYTKKFAGDYLLPEIAAPLYPPMYNGKELLASVQSFNTDSYCDHLLDCLLLDLETQSAQIRLYDLYGVSLEVSDASQDIYKLHVPGIREGAPILAYGDQVGLRQLRLDPETSLPLGMEAFFYSGGESDGRTPAPGFTGYQINAVVVAVAKSVEDVFLRVNGVLPERLVFNVCFDVQARHFQSVQRAIESVRGLAVENPTQDKPSHWLRCMLFPGEADGILQENPPSGKFRQTWVDQTLNYEQKASCFFLSSFILFC